MNITINDWTEEENINNWLAEDQLSRLEVRFVKTITAYNEASTEYAEIKHYPLATLVPDQASAQHAIDEARKIYVGTLQSVVNDFLAKEQAGILYFGPANRFCCANTEGKIFYIFSYKKDDGHIELMFESNFVILSNP